MLPRVHRMTSRTQFAETISRGARAGSRSLVVHAVPADAVPDQAAPPPVVVGYVVSKAVGNSVVRHRVLRQLRAQTAQRLPLLAGHRALVVRALPAAAGKSSADLGAELERALTRAARQKSRAPEPTGEGR
jgi:ribonuclease P protein component